jgi:cation diffusion facilitator CzcD-associated flavoprotein CzcO
MDAIIIGAGMSGMLAAIKLDDAGHRNWVMVDKASDIGGTWHENVYPGCGCDVPSHLYSYSFAPNPNWTRGYPLQAEIKAYFKGVAEKYDLPGRTRLNTEATAAKWDAKSATWTVTLATKEKLTAPILIMGCGQLNKPMIPDIPGRAKFKGPQFHSATWDHSVSLAGKRVAVIGSGASAVQLVPHVVEAAGHMTLFQRTPNWFIERNDEPISEKTQRLFARHDWIRKLARFQIFYGLNLLSEAFEKPGGKVARQLEEQCTEYMHSIIKDPELRRKLTPDYAVGCKRILFADDFFPALTKPNAFVEDRPIKAIEAKGIRLEDGTLVPADIIIWGTGFDTHHFIAPMEVTGADGVKLADAWKEGAEAYRGVSVSGFPNMFILYGPNTNTGNISIIYMVEQQMRYVMQGIRRITMGPGTVLDVRAEAQAAHNVDIQARLAKTSWAAGCNSWYRTASGKIPNNYPGRALQFAREMRHFEDEAYDRRVLS